MPALEDHQLPQPQGVIAAAGEVFIDEAVDEARLEVAALLCPGREERVGEQLAQPAAEPEAEGHAEPLFAPVHEAARQEDALALEIVRDTARFLGIGISNLLNVFNPDMVVVAGGVTQAGDALFEPLRVEVRRRAFRPAVDACQIVPGSLPLSAGVVGAVATFRAQTFGDL